MRIAILTLFPEIFECILSVSILGRARAEGLLAVEPIDIRLFSDKKHKNADDYPFGGGAGMVMTAQPIVDAVRHARSTGHTGPCIYVSPRGNPLNQSKVCELAKEESLLLLCGHYEGVDQRAIDLVADMEISIGDFVLTGGELAAMVLTDAVARHIPGVLGSKKSAEEESFSAGLLEYPQFTRPRSFEGLGVPEVLLNGNHAEISAWRREQALLATLAIRPDLFIHAPMTEAERIKTFSMLSEMRKAPSQKEENPCC
ncbi:MAG: tRNA (guanosine(37)-N1)-methyltransferase TrmD [Clostridia bacterium]|nr:tRNA (guanosine(37)-N1)-methyltransferase TrmD [Clostridia bacterium]